MATDTNRREAASGRITCATATGSAGRRVRQSAREVPSLSRTTSSPDVPSQGHGTWRLALVAKNLRG